MAISGYPWVFEGILWVYGCRVWGVEVRRFPVNIRLAPKGTRIGVTPDVGRQVCEMLPPGPQEDVARFRV